MSFPQRVPKSFIYSLWSSTAADAPSHGLSGVPEIGMTTAPAALLRPFACNTLRASIRHTSRWRTLDEARFRSEAGGQSGHAGVGGSGALRSLRPRCDLAADRHR